MRKLAAAVGFALFTAVIAAGSAHAIGPGVSRGTVVTVGEDRLVVQLAEGGQRTFEAGQVKEGDQLVPNKANITLIATFQPGDLVQVGWYQDHTGHYTIRQARKIASLVNEGKVRGTVITMGEQNLVIQKETGGQMTLEPGWVKVDGKYARNQEQIAYFRTLKQGDRIEATWKLDEGTHFCVASITKLGADGGEPLQAQVRALRDEVGALRLEIAALRQMVAKALEQK